MRKTMIMSFSRFDKSVTDGWTDGQTDTGGRLSLMYMYSAAC